jgi:hypothetical protein
MNRDWTSFGLKDHIAIVIGATLFCEVLYLTWSSDTS